MSDDAIRAMSLTEDERVAIVNAMNEQLEAHAEHPWHKVGRCVYCGPCRARLYQGEVPEGHPVWTPPRRPSRGDEMRARWGMD